MRLSSPEHLRIVQSNHFDVEYGGGEANVAVSLAQFGVPAAFITRLPDNELGKAALASLDSRGVNTSFIRLGGERLGIYFLEKGANVRPGKVIYDRANSSMAGIRPGMIDWGSVFREAHWFHWTGITPALSQSAADVCLEALKTAKEMGLTISGDPNYRSNLWQYDVAPDALIRTFIGYCDVLIASEFDASRLLGVEDQDLNFNQVHAMDGR